MGKAMAARNVTHAARIIERTMRLESEGWPGVQEMSRWSARRVLAAYARRAPEVPTTNTTDRILREVRRTTRRMGVFRTRHVTLPAGPRFPENPRL